MRVIVLLLALMAGACVAAPPTATVEPTRTLAPVAATPLPPTETATFSDETSVLQISPTPLTPSPVPATALPTQVTPGDVQGIERRLRETPILHNLTTERVRQIFAQGERMGNRADVFTTIGDSNTTNGDFLQPIGMNADAYCTFGDHASLRESVAYFSVPPVGDAGNSFTHQSEAAKMGFNSAAVLDPFWASSTSCAAGESPLLCEYRRVKPSVAVIMIGGIDVSNLTTAEYSANLRRIVHDSIQQGVIPVLTTFVVLPEREDVYGKSLEFNMALLDIAAEEQIPLINLWAAAQTLPNVGIGPDRTHLKAEVGSFCAFDGAQTRLGGTLRNLLTLQALDVLRQNVLTK